MASKCNDPVEYAFRENHVLLKQLIATAPRKAELKLYEESALQPEEVRVKVEHASPKHGSELAAFRGESPHSTQYFDKEWLAFLHREARPQEVFGEWNLGNQFVGTITEIGPLVSGFSIGDRVCGYGGIRETICVNPAKSDLRLVPEGMSWKNAVCYDPAHFAMAGVREGGIRIGDRVAVFGLGALGQLSAQLAKLAGASYVAVVDPIVIRREIALNAGADAAYDPLETDVGMELKRDTGKLGVDVVIESSASEHALQQALRGLAYGGTVSYIGWARPFSGGMDWGQEAHFNNAKIVFARANSEPNPDHPRWNFKRIRDTCWDLLKEGKLQCDDIINPVVPFADCARAYEHFVDQHPEKSVKLGVSFK